MECPQKSSTCHPQFWLQYLSQTIEGAKTVGEKSRPPNRRTTSLRRNALPLWAYRRWPFLPGDLPGSMGGTLRFCAVGLWNPPFVQRCKRLWDATRFNGKIPGRIVGYDHARHILWFAGLVLQARLLALAILAGSHLHLPSGWYG